MKTRVFFFGDSFKTMGYSLLVTNLEDLDFVVQICTRERKSAIALLYINGCPYCERALVPFKLAAQESSVLFVHVNCTVQKAKCKSRFGISTFPATLRFSRGMFEHVDPLERTVQGYTALARTFH